MTPAPLPGTAASGVVATGATASGAVATGGGTGGGGSSSGGAGGAAAWRSRGSTALFLAVALAGWFGTQVSMLVTRDGWSLRQFRDYFPSDQVSYMAIVVEGSQGRFDFYEPFTRTGLDFYPHAYYLLLGAVSWLTGVGPLATWAAVGLLTQAVLVVGVGLTCVRFTGRAWTAALAPLPMVVGTFATVTGSGSWFTELDRHAVIWGAYGVFFTLNGEAVGLTLGALGLLGLVSVAQRPAGVGRPLARAVVAAAAIGLAANVQTYSFLAATYLAVYGAAVHGLVLRRARWSSALTAVLLLALFLLGGTAHDTLGPLAVLLAGLLPALPGLVALLRTVGPRLFVPVAALALAALPQVLWTAWGVVSGEPFLLYRQSSTSDLGVPLGDFVVAGGIVVVALAGVLAAGLHRGRPLWVSAPLGAALAWFLVGGNDHWGAEQEPYRLWIDAFTLLAFVALPIGAAVAADVLGRRPSAAGLGRRPVAAGPASVGPVAGGPAGAAPTSRRAATVGAVWLVVVVGLTATSIGDWWRFWHDTRETGFLTFYGAREDAMREVLQGHDERLVLPDTCLDPFDLKIATGVPVAYYNLGMAWPPAASPHCAPP